MKFYIKCYSCKYAKWDSSDIHDPKLCCQKEHDNVSISECKDYIKEIKQYSYGVSVSKRGEDIGAYRQMNGKNMYDILDWIMNRWGQDAIDLSDFDEIQIVKHTYKDCVGEKCFGCDSLIEIDNTEGYCELCNKLCPPSQCPLDIDYEACDDCEYLSIGLIDGDIYAFCCKSDKEICKIDRKINFDLKKAPKPKWCSLRGD
jgi:hypothetical protein